MEKKLLELGLGIKPIINNKYEITYLDYIKRKVPNNSKFVKFNMNKMPMPFKDNSFDVIIAFNILEHLSPIVNGREMWLEKFNEFYRILKPNGIIKIIVPHYTNGFIQEHRVQFSSWNIEYIFGKEENWITDMSDFNFEIERNYIQMNRAWKFLEKIINKNKINQEIWEKYLCYIIRPKDLEIKLRAIKYSDK